MSVSILNELDLVRAVRCSGVDFAFSQRSIAQVNNDTIKDLLS